MKFLDEFFNDLTLSKSKEDLLNLFIKFNINRRNRDKYPDLEINISLEEIKKLEENSIITNENNLNVLLAKKTDLTTLEKLLYAVVWKNGDLIKIKHIISGIYGNAGTTGKVFNQFGRFLSNKDELIIDQHVLRAFIYFKDKEIIKNINNKHFDLFTNDYKNWIYKNDVYKNNKNIIDELLFEVGKKIKSNKGEKNRK